METITTINGNKQPVTKDLPKIIWWAKNVNEVALDHVFENTGLRFERTEYGCMPHYEAQPTASSQIAALFMTYNFKTRYYNNWEFENTLILKNDHHIGFDVESVCFECLKHNHININGLKPGDYLAC